MENKKYEILEPKNNKLKIKNYIVDNKGVRIYTDDFKELLEIPEKLKKYSENIYELYQETTEKIYNFGIGEEIELFNTENELIDMILNKIIIGICSKIERDYNLYISKQKAILKNNPNMLIANENIVNLILEDPVYKTVKEDISPMDINIILSELNAEYNREQKVEVLKKAIEEYSSNKRDLINKHAIKASELYKSLNISDYAQVLLYIIKNIY